MKDEIKNNYIDGKCSRCGECCTPFIPITNKEYKTGLKKYNSGMERRYGCYIYSTYNSSVC